MSEIKRKLNEFCPECGYPTIEEICDFKGEKLAVSVCLNINCDEYDWEIPSKAGEVETEEEIEIFDESCDWAEEQARKIKFKFLTQKPVVFKLSVTEQHVKDFLATKYISTTTYRSYQSLLLKFVEWLKNRVGKKEN